MPDRSKYKPKGTKFSLNVSVTEKPHSTGTRTSTKPKSTTTTTTTKPKSTTTKPRTTSVKVGGK